jgi:hypothetical protein
VHRTPSFYIGDIRGWSLSKADYSALLRKSIPEGWQLISTILAAKGDAHETDVVEDISTMVEIQKSPEGWQLISTTFHVKDPATETGVVESISTTVERQRSPFHASVRCDLVHGTAPPQPAQSCTPLAT